MALNPSTHKPAENWIDLNPLNFLLYLTEAGAGLRKHREEWQQYQERIAKMEREIDFLKQQQARHVQMALDTVNAEWDSKEIERAIEAAKKAEAR